MMSKIASTAVIVSRSVVYLSAISISKECQAIKQQERDRERKRDRCK